MKISKVIIVSFVLLLVGAVGYLVTRNSTSRPIPYPNQSSNFTYQPKSKINIPTSNKIKIGEIEVKNFYFDSTETTDFGDALVFRGQDFHIVYIDQEKFFILSVNGKPFNVIIKTAEEQLLKSLDINQQEACKLNVRSTDSTETNPTEILKRYKLSFCG